MPRSHREFLCHVSRVNNLRQFVSGLADSQEIHDAHNDAVAALVMFRNIHIQIVARYIVMPSRSPPASYIKQKKGLNLATASLQTQTAGLVAMANKRQLQGTGGTNLMPFLKRTRDETRDAAICALKS